MRKNKVQEAAIGVHYGSSVASKIFDFCNAAFMILFCITILLPFWDLIVKFFSRRQDISYKESASMDGASYFRIFGSIIIPLSKPVLATVALWQIVGHWNAWFDNMIYNRNSQHLMTLQYLLRRMLEKASRTSETAYAMELTGAFSDISSEAVKAAVTVIVVLPIIINIPLCRSILLRAL